MKVNNQPETVFGEVTLQNKGPGCPVERRSPPGGHHSYPTFSATESIHANPQILSLLPLTPSSTALSTAQEIPCEEAPINQTMTTTVTHVSGSKCYPCSSLHSTVHLEMVIKEVKVRTEDVSWPSGRCA